MTFNAGLFSQVWAPLLATINPKSKLLLRLLVCHHPQVQEFFDRWSSEGVVDFKEELSDLIILTASRTLLGELLSASELEPLCSCFALPS